MSPERFTLTRVLPSFPTKPPCNRYERLSLGVLLWCLWLWSWCRCSPAAVSEVKNDAYVLKRLPVETRRVAWTWEMSRCGRVVLVSVVELLTVMFVLHVTQTSGVNTCMFSLLILFYSVQLSHLQSLYIYIYNMLSQMWINQLTPDVFIQLLHVKRNSYVNIIWLYIIFISSVSCNKPHVFLFSLSTLTHRFCTKCDTLHWDCATEFTVSTIIRIFH